MFLQARMGDSILCSEDKMDDGTVISLKIKIDDEVFNGKTIVMPYNLP
jgi:hypothetical protein